MTPPVILHNASPQPCQMRAALPSVEWLVVFVLVEIASQLLLLVVNQGVLRLPLRMAAYATSLAFVFLIPNRAKSHPTAGLTIFILGLYCLSLFNVNTRLLPGLAQITLTAAILAPLLWAPRLAISLTTLKRVLAVVWIFSLTSAGLGVLQVEFPGRFDPVFSEALIQMKSSQLAKTYVMKNAKGEEVQRPMGLTDTPGGAGTHGAFAVLLGLAGFFTARRRAVQLMLGAGMVVGLAAVFLSQVRLFTVMLAISVFTLLLVIWIRGEAQRLRSLAVILPILALGGFGLAYAVGGETTSRRLLSLVSDNPAEIYYSNRGQFIQSTFEQDIPRYPLGAGLGRWGMISFYFANQDDPTLPKLWAEVEWTGWIYDGGVPLTLAYTSLMIVACLGLWRLTASPNESHIRIAAAVVLAYTVGGIAATFCFPIFHSQIGMDLWMLNGILFAASRTPGGDLSQTQ